MIFPLARTVSVLYAASNPCAAGNPLSRARTATRTLLLFALLLATGCGPRDDAPATARLFVLQSPEQTNVDFSNALSHGPGVNRNVLMYEYFYNGGGVAVGDVNGDDLEDLYFVGNMTYNKLYLNKGNMEFEDVTDAANIAGRKNTWSTGVAMADVNGDGLLDLYVCYSGQLPPARRVDELYINQGVDARGIPQFEERAAEYGLAHPHSSNAALFFDYDRDGDLDLFLVNHNVRSLPVLREADTRRLLDEPDPVNGARLYQNDGGRFVDVTESAGIESSPLTYGLGAGVSDVNKDGWPDLYVGNDYAPPDYLYINNGDGTFSDELQRRVGHTSYASMGIDLADVNNDGLPDVVVLDMLPEDNRRQKLLNIPNDRNRFDMNVAVGFHHQYMRNTLQLNNGNGTFSEIGQLAGISNTDWSWAPLVADYDNDGWKDLFVTNGILHDITNLDYIGFQHDYIRQRSSQLQPRDVLHLLDRLPSHDLPNYIYKNNGDLTFRDVTQAWGLDRPVNSNGAAYADLDRDGDLDLITNNLDEPASIFENIATAETANYYLQIRLKGAGQNTYGIGASVTLYTNGQQQYLEQMPMRGYLSSVSPVLHAGLGRHASVDSLLVVWPDGKQQVLADVSADQTLTLHQQDASEDERPPRPASPLFEQVATPVDFRHRMEGDVDDFRRQPLMVNPKSFAGPALAKADVNGDGRMDLFAGGGRGQAGRLYLQRPDGRFRAHPQPAFEADKNSSDVDALFFDADGDGHLDLYVASGGYDTFDPADPALQDRLYVNDGAGHFARRPSALPEMNTSTGAVTASDVNDDGFPDLFVGGRVIPGRYPLPPRSYVLMNDGQGRFENRTAEVAPDLQRIGMVSDARWHDLNGDGRNELIVAGEWMPISVFGTTGGTLSNQTDAYFERPYYGLWNALQIEDLNGDGHPDLVAGNFGLNAQLQADAEQPAALYYKDFDRNGTIDPILSFYIQGTRYPYVTLDELTQQIVAMRSRFPTYAQYADATLEDIFTARELQGAEQLRADHLETTLFLSEGGNRFRQANLPSEVQFAPVFAVTTLDYNRDGHRDLLLGGNINEARIRFGKYDANYGMLLAGDGEGRFTYLPQRRSGFRLRGDVRSILNVNGTLLFGINRAPIEAYRATGR